MCFSKTIAARLLAVCLPTCAAFSAEVIFDESTAWRYWKGTSEASSPDTTAWRDRVFDDTFWPEAQAPFFYERGSGYTGNTELIDMPNGYSCVFLRKTFRIDTAILPPELILDVRSDDGCVVWINGVEVLRVNVPAGEIPYDGTSLNASGEPNIAGLTVPNTDTFLVTGDNVIAIQAVNASLGGSSDFLIAASLASDLDLVAPTVISVFPDAGSTVRALTEIEVVFSESVQGVDSPDLLVNGVAASGLAVYSPREYTFTVQGPAAGTAQVAWANNHGVTDLAPTPNAFAGGSWDLTVDPTAPPELLRITEFLAANANGLRDDNGERSDWIEIYNPSTTALNLSGWSLADDPANIGQWRFPDVIIGGGDYLLIWASGKNRTNAAAPLHTDFRLSDDGEYLSLANPEGTVVAAYAPSYPAQQPDISYGLDAADPSILGYFPTPTPGEPNLPGGPGFAPTPEASLAGGVYTDSPLTVQLSAPSGVIHYTTDGSVPSGRSPVYSTALTLTGSTLLQARTFEDGLLPSAVVTRHYTLAGNSVAAFSSNLPLLIIDPLNRSIPQDVRVPVGVTVVDTWRGRAQIGATPQFEGLGEAEIRGQTSAGFPKKPYNLELNDAFGNDLEVPLLGLPAESDWALHNPYSDKSLLNNFLTYELHEKMGHYAARRRFVEVFVDQSGGRLEYPGDYMGVYVLLEKIKVDNNRVDLARLTPDQNDEPEITGGYIVKKDKSSPGDRIFSTQGGAGFGAQSLRIHEPKPDEITQAQLNWIRSYLVEFEQSLYASNWRTATGTNHYSHFIDVDSFVDNHWIVEFTKQIDGYRLSNYMSKDRGGKLRMAPIWDWNLSLGNADYLRGEFTSGWYWNQISADQHIYLRRLMTGTTSSSGTSGDPDFLQRIIDRWGVLRTDILAGTNVVARIDELAALLNESQARDFQRWPRLGTYVWPNPQFYVSPTTHAGIIAAKKSWVANRFAWIDNQYPLPPAIESPGGYVTPGFPVSVATEESALYTTLTGTDPRKSGGGISSDAAFTTGPVSIDNNALLMARSRRSSTWSGPSSAMFITDPSPLRITEVLYRAGPASPGDTNAFDTLEFLEICNLGSSVIDLTGYSFTDGVNFSFATGAVATLSPGTRCVVVRDSTAFTARYGDQVSVAGTYDGALDNNGERITLSGPFGEVVQSFRYDPEWYPATDGLGYSLVPAEEGDALTDWAAVAAWRSSAAYGGSPGSGDAAAPTFPLLVINEALTHTDLPLVDSIEIHNPGSTEVSLAGWWLSDDPRTPKYPIPSDRSIPPDGYIVFTEADFNAPPGAPGNFNLRSSGDEAYLFTADATGRPTGYRHGFSFGAALNGVAFGRHVNSEGRELFVAQSASTPGAPNAALQVGPVVVSEIMYHPPDVLSNGGVWNNTEDEFVELVNITAAPVPLYDPQALTNTWQLRDAVRYSFPTNETLDVAERILVVSFDPVADPSAATAFRNRLAVPAGVRLFGPFDGELANSGESVELVQPDLVRFYVTNEVVTEVMIDRVRYRDHAPWPAGADGFGFSLQRVSEAEFGDEPLSWLAAAPTAGAASVPGNTPTITTQPQSQTVTVGGSVSFQIEASGPGPLQFQWRHNDTPLLGATNSTLALFNAQPEAAGRYDVVVWSAQGGAAGNSSPAMLIVEEPPRIHEQPQSVTMQAGEEVEFSLLASSSKPMQFQWRLNGTPLVGADRPILHFAAGSDPAPGTYDVVIRTITGSVTSAPAMLIIEGIALIQHAPFPIRAPEGGSATFSVELLPAASPPFEYVWSKDGTVLDTRSSDQPLDFFTFNDLTAGDAGLVSVTVTDALAQGDVSAPVSLTVLPDTDGDGMPDEYETAQGFVIEDPRDANSDGDGDGASNLEEYLAGTDPADAGSVLRLEATPESPDVRLRFTGVADRTYAIQHLDSVGAMTWENIAAFPATSDQTGIPRLIEVLDQDVLPASQRYYRVISPPPAN